MYTQLDPLHLTVSNTVFRLLNKKQQHQEKYKNSRVYKLVRHTPKKLYVGLTGRCLRVRFNKRIRYIRTNNTNLHILCIFWRNSTMDLLKPCEKDIRLNSWESYYILEYQMKGQFVEKQNTQEVNSLLQLAKVYSLPNGTAELNNTPNHTSIHVVGVI